MNSSIRLGIIATAAIALLGLTVGCSSDDSADQAATTTVTVTSAAAASSSSVAASTPAPQPGRTEFEAVGQGRPASDFTDGSAYSFKSPSGKIECRSTSTTLVCQTLDNRHTVDPALLCNFYPGDEQGNANQFGFFDFDKPICATIVQGEAIRSPHTLEYNQRVAFTPRPDLTIVCRSETIGVTCTNFDGFGFTLSDTTFSRFRAN